MGLAGLFSGENLDLWLCLVVPPLIVKRKRGIGTDFYISIELTILGWIPGTMMAIYILFADVPMYDEELQSVRPSEQTLKRKSRSGEGKEAKSRKEGESRGHERRQVKPEEADSDARSSSECLFEYERALAKRRERKRRKEKRRLGEEKVLISQ